MKLKVLDFVFTPNPHAIKFIVNAIITTQPKTVTSIAEAGANGLSEELLRLSGVESIFYLDNFITITKSSYEEWDTLIELAKALIESTDFFPLQAQEAVLADAIPIAVPDDFLNLSQKQQLAVIDSLINHAIRPGLKMDGGDIDLVAFSDNKLTIKYKGACGSCPSSTTTTLRFIEQTLKSKINANIRVALAE